MAKWWLHMFAIAISYAEYEEKVKDVDTIVNNSVYVYSDIDLDEVIIFQPSEKLLEWLKQNNVVFRLIDEKELEEIITKIINI